MGEGTAIQWAHDTFNAWAGCTEDSPGCALCYARKQAARNPKVLGAWGPRGTRPRTSPANWAKPLAWNKAAALSGEERRVFTMSMGDLLEGRETMPPKAWATVEAARGDLWELITATPALTWMLLTKRPQNARQMMPASWMKPGGWPAHAWFGVTAESPEELERRGRWGVQVPAAVRFLSLEPLLAPMPNLAKWLNMLHCDDIGAAEIDEVIPGFWMHGAYFPPMRGNPWYRGFEQAIVGGESGARERVRIFDLQWARDIRDVCALNRVAFFFKQSGHAWCDSATDPYCTFENFGQWVNKAGSWLGGMSGGGLRYKKPERMACLDARGRSCRIGADFMRARDQHAFPVRAYPLQHDMVHTLDGVSYQEFPGQERTAHEGTNAQSNQEQGQGSEA